MALSTSLVEVALRPDRAWLLVTLAVSIVIALSLLWRRTQPLAAVAVGTLTTVDVARILSTDDTAHVASISTNDGPGLLFSVAAALVLPYALFRWGSGREALSGLGIILVWLGVTHVADPSTVWEVVSAYGFFLFSAALGASIRFRATTRLRDIEQAELRQRHELARDLHDTIGHHMSGIVIQAQAGQALAASGPDRSLAVFRTIEEAATRALAEMRTIVGVLRVGAEPDLTPPQPGLSDIECLARTTDTPAIEVHLSACWTTCHRRSAWRSTGSPRNLSSTRGATPATSPACTSRSREILSRFA